MAINLNAKTTGVGGLETSADNSGEINIQSGGSTVMSVTSSGVAVTGSFSQNGAVYSTQPTFRNLIINGDMRIDQRNAGSSVSVANTGVYTVDRWRASNGTSTATVQQSSTAPTGFSNSLLWTVSTTDNTANQSHALQHKIEGYNTAFLNLGTANAETVTLSFWVRSSLTGTYGIGINNSAENRSYVATYTISSADTWEQKTITFTNDTSGTWVGSTNGIGILINFDLGSGSDFNGTADTWQSGNYRRTSGCVNLANTSGATFYITGVQLEVGSTATDFENLPYDVQLQRCYRYYWQQVAPVSGTRAFATGSYLTSAYVEWAAQFPVTMRATPSVVSPTVVGGYEIYRNSGADAFDVVLLGAATTNSAFLYNNTQVSGTAGQAGSVYSNNSSASLAFSAEL